MHPWRVCPIGKHYVKTHDMFVPSSEKYPGGHIGKRQGHCARNPTHKELMSYAELQIISKAHWKKTGVLVMHLD